VGPATANEVNLRSWYNVILTRRRTQSIIRTYLTQSEPVINLQLNNALEKGKTLAY